MERFRPHPYQERAVRFIETHPEAAVMLDMGLGKTAITLTAINELMFDMFTVHRVLVIAPLRVARDTWPGEAAKWSHLSGLKVSVAVGGEAERLAALKAPADVFVINRENVQWLVEKSGLKFDWDMVVVDELSSFKNHESKRFKALMKVRPKVRRIVGLTGTPAPNGLMDLWAEYRLLDMGKRLGRYIGQYRESYFQPDKRSMDHIYSYKPLPHADEAIYGQIRDITISMRSQDHLTMPRLVMNTVPVRLSPAERAVYDRLRDEMVVDLHGHEVDAVNAGGLAGKLLQMANGTVYDDERNPVHVHDRKLDALEDLVEAANGKPVLVTYWYRHDRDRIRARFHGARDLRSSRDIADWNAGRIPLALIHPQAAGHGLNLQAGGSTLIWFGLTWSLELYQQTNARLWRQGQQSQTVVVHHIVAEGTIDEAVLRALHAKDRTQSALIDAVKAQLGGMEGGGR